MLSLGRSYDKPYLIYTADQTTLYAVENFWRALSNRHLYCFSNDLGNLTGHSYHLIIVKDAMFLTHEERETLKSHLNDEHSMILELP